MFSGWKEMREEILSRLKASFPAGSVKPGRFCGYVYDRSEYIGKSTKHRHLILSDIHENADALMRLVLKALRMPGGIDDIWLLGDLFGHSENAIGVPRLQKRFLSVLKDLEQFPIYSVFGNWEFWLFHPENDQKNSAQSNAQETLASRRRMLQRSKPVLLRGMMKNSILMLPEQQAEFTLFHGCSYSCHNTTEYQADPWESYLNPHDLNIVTRGLFGNPEHLQTDHFLFGHTHKPGFFAFSKSSFVNMWRVFTPEMAEKPLSYKNGGYRYGINPGSAGIENGNIPRTGVVLDTAEKTFQFIIDSENEYRISRRQFLHAVSLSKKKSSSGEKNCRIIRSI